MQKPQDNKILITVTLIGLGLIAGAFALVAWFVGGGFELGSQSTNNQSTQKNNQSSIPNAGTPDEESSGAPLSDIQNVPQGLFNYGGSTTWIPLHEPINNVITASFPDFQLRYTLPSSGIPGSGTGIKMLLDSQLSFSESSRPLKPTEYESAQQRGFTLEQIPVAIDGIALAVHPDLGMAGLNVDQIKAIYTGKVTNWSELGGPNLPITAYSRSPETTGTANYFLEEVIAADAFSETVIFVDDTTAGIRQVINNKGGIYYASAPEVVDQCLIYAIPLAAQNQTNNFIPPFADTWRTGQDCLNQTNTVNETAFREGSYPLTRRLFVIVKADGAIDESAGRAYVNILLSPVGQSLIDQAGFVSIQ
ncbi:PstS family phosphate ABC transporter substrate-binding protein [Leptothoe sp. PORK10 BA2]|uniref:PstS family phosphate ABC transporter substrate-binding protein n=1 Tax=Leptothoe sp. PORK10 BA2 TaxID=3110254 RepID=UPI002B21B6B9|nr:substrate-binding domain-containing protein [Leptothoe sp. PORK10 BA2]MEA5464426.1 substrate-binding domain-containing protein [Leptothoe sp. PORK10 BA2]